VEIVYTKRTRKIAGAGLDIYWTEPRVGEPSPPKELFKMDNVILTPHIGSVTHETPDKMATAAATNLIAMIKGETPRICSTPRCWSHRARAYSNFG
jgi:phosphoglycerate dehydrogenase-like enzyme